MEAAQELKSAADELGRQEALQRLECQVKQPEGDPGQSVKYEPVFVGKNCNAEKFEMKSGNLEITPYKVRNVRILYLELDLELKLGS